MNLKLKIKSASSQGRIKCLLPKYILISKYFIYYAFFCYRNITINIYLFHKKLNEHTIGLRRKHDAMPGASQHRRRQVVIQYELDPLFRRVGINLRASLICYPRDQVWDQRRNGGHNSLKGWVFIVQESCLVP